MKTSLVLILMMATLLLAGAAEAQQAAGFRPVASVIQLMKSIVIPTSEAVFGVAKEPPKNDAEWAALQDQAITLAESGNLLMLRPPSKDRSNWMKYSRALVDAGESAGQAAKAKNVDGVLGAGDVIYAACDGCHQQYMKK